MEDFDALASFRFYPAGTLLITEEQTPEDVFILLHGEVRLSVTSSVGKRFILRIAHPGEILGLASLFSGNCCEMTAESMYPCEIAQVPKVDFLGFLGRYPPVFQSAARELSLYYEQACVRLRTMGVTSHVAPKLAHLILEWSSSETNCKPPGNFIRVPLTHAEIGECIGASRETVTRLLTRLQRQRIVEIQGSILRILDRPTLEDWPA
jgi:CRP/FNR family transcriptional regulator